MRAQHWSGLHPLRPHLQHRGGCPLEFPPLLALLFADVPRDEVSLGGILEVWKPPLPREFPLNCPRPPLDVFPLDPLLLLEGGCMSCLLNWPLAVLLTWAAASLSDFRSNL